MNTVLCEADASWVLDETNNIISVDSNRIVMILETIWSALLNQNKVGLDDSVFYFGSDSIDVLKLIFRIKENFHINLLFREIFDNSTIHKLSILIEKKLLEKN